MKALVLNQDYQPISICSVQRAFVLVFLKKVKMLSTFDNKAFHTVRETYEVPAVIQLHEYINVPYRSVELSRNNIFKRDNFTCQYCGCETDLSLDHVIPKSKGGRSNWSNLVTACKKCNALKGDDLPDEAGMPLEILPYKPSYIMFLREFSGYRYPEWLPYLGVKSA